MNWETQPAANAFPLQVNESLPSDSTVHYGLTKREYFAAMAMQGLLAADVKSEHHYLKIAEWSVLHADVLIEQLNKARDS